MCPPAALMAIATVATVGTSIYSGIQANAAGAQQQAALIEQGIATRKIAEINAREYERQAALRLEKGKFDSAQAITKYQRLAGEQSAKIGKTGLDIGTFSDVLADSALENALEVKQINWTADQEAYNLRFQAQSARYNADLEAKGLRLQGKAARTQGRAAMIEGFGNAFSAGVKGYGDWSSSVSISSPWATNTYDANGNLK